jgi:hypothetical protein
MKPTANRNARTFPNLTISYCFRVGPTISKNDEARNVARLYHQFTFALTPYALLNLSRNFYDRIDKLRQALTRRLHVRTTQSVGNRL